MKDGEDADRIARACAEAMFADDTASRALGMTIDAIAPGRARLSMTVTDKMANGHDMCHGGYIFTLADSAMAFASNTYDQRAVAHHCAVTFITSAGLGDRLTAVAEQRSREGRSGIYDVTVSRDDGVVVAEFRGHTRTIKGRLLEEPEQ
jgi:acyl-CoA thioesterase